MVTNYEKIKAMSVEEMAMLMPCPDDGNGEEEGCYLKGKRCDKCRIEWLLQEAEE
jgi:hypothetical protein